MCQVGQMLGGAGVVIDKLTGLLNRWHWDQRAAEAMERAGARATALLLVVVDGFPRISNRDEVLRAVSAVLRKTLRTTDLTGRYDDHGGDGFLVLLPARDRQLGELIA